MQRRKSRPGVMYTDVDSGKSAEKARAIKKGQVSVFFPNVKPPRKAVTVWLEERSSFPPDAED